MRYKRKVLMKLIKLKDIFETMDRKGMSLKEGSNIAGYSYWHFIRLYKKYKKDGITSFKWKRETN